MYIINPSQSSSNSLVPNCITFDDYDNSPEITLNVNIHFTPNRYPSQNEAILGARRLINDINTVFENLGPYNLTGPNGMVVPFVRRAKIKLKLYSEPTNTADVNGGIWFYDANSDWFDAVDRYNGRAQNIVITSSAPGAACGNAGWVFDVGTQFNRWVYVQDLFCFRDFGLGGTPSVLAHEIGHSLGLDHPTFCTNVCGGVDINLANECNPTCPNERPETCVTGSGENGGPRLCSPLDANGNPTRRLCNVENRSNNITASGGPNLGVAKSITPCQWRVMFNDVRTGGSQYALLCRTAANFNLTTSPLNDYRAAQTITSTSVLNGLASWIIGHLQ